MDACPRPAAHAPSRWRLLVLASSLAALALAGARPAAVPTLPLDVRLARAKAGDVVEFDGEHRGSVQVPAGVSLVGRDGARVVADGTGVTLADGASLRGVAVVGEPAVRVSSGAKVVLADVVAAGGRAGLVVDTRADVQLVRVTATCRPVEETTGGAELPTALVANGATLTIDDATLGRACHRAIGASGGTLHLARSRLEAFGSGVRALDLALDASDVSIAIADPESGAALYVARSRVTLERLTFVGGAHGLLSRASRVVATGIDARAVTNAAVSIVNGTAELSALRLQGPFGFAAVSGSDAVALDLTGLEVTRAGRTAVTVVRTPLSLRRATLSGLRVDRDGDLGHGVMAVDSPARLEALDVSDGQGAAVWLQRGDATLSGLDARGVHAAWVQLGGSAAIDGLRVASDVGVSVVAGGGARVEVASGRLDSAVGTSRCAGASLSLAPAVAVTSPTPTVSCGDADLRRGLFGVTPRPSR